MTWDSIEAAYDVYWSLSVSTLVDIDVDIVVVVVVLGIGVVESSHYRLRCPLGRFLSQTNVQK